MNVFVYSTLMDFDIWNTVVKDTYKSKKGILKNYSAQN